MDLIGDKSFHFQNWAQTYECYPQFYFEPKDLNEIRQILIAAQENKKNVKVVGMGSSPSQLACTDGYMINMKKFDKVLHIDHDKHTVKVQAGLPISKLNELLHDNNLAFPVLSTVSNITLPGAISTATHGSGMNYHCLSFYVLELEMMLANGSMVILTKNDGDAFSACCVSLGSLGVIVSVVYQCRPKFNLIQCSYPLHYKELLENIDVHLSSSDHFRFHWYPHTDMCQVQHIKHTNLPITKNRSPGLLHYLTGYVLHQSLLWLSSFFPSITAYINKWWFLLFKSSKTEEVDVSYKIFNFDCFYHQYVMEWAIPIEETSNFFVKLDSWIKSTGFSAHFPVEFRFSKADDILLSPSYGRDTCHVNIISWRPFGKDIPRESYWNEVEKLALECGGRPHWAKDHHLMATDLNRLYPKWENFLAVRKEFDPQGIFLNDYLRKMFSFQS